MSLIVSIRVVQVVPIAITIMNFVSSKLMWLSCPEGRDIVVYFHF